MSNNNGVRIELPLGELIRNIQGIEPFVRRAAVATLDRYAGVIESAARTNAPWTDRTSNARNGLFTHVSQSGEMVYSLDLAHRVPYGIWLEVRWSGRYAIIMPTLQEYGPRVMATFDGLLDRYQGA